MTEVEQRVLDWIEARRDSEQVIRRWQCSVDIGVPFDDVTEGFRVAMMRNLIGWDQRCYYTISREASR